MIPNKADTLTVTSSIDGETGQFSVDENSLAKIMSVLTNLYSDPEGAVVREYLTNALDAQIEAQADPNYVWRPIEVTTPSHFNKTYTVRDFGIGMSVDDIKEIYSKYGKSTKESSNDVTGMLGLGSKCALTYTGQFTIIGYKNGVQTKAIVSKDDNDIPVFMIVDTRATTEPNGVEISVPVRDRNTFAEKTRDFLRWWKEGQVLVNGAEPTKHDLPLVSNDPMTFTVNGKSITTPVEIYLAERVYANYRWSEPQSLVIMGNVPYAVDSEYVAADLRNSNLGFVAYVPMGSVDFPPSREKLFFNNRTKRTVTAISEGLFEKVLDGKLKEITDAPTHKEAYLAWTNLDRVFSTHNKAKGLKYKGDSFVSSFQHSHLQLTWDYNDHGQISERSMVNMNEAIQGSMVVTGIAPGTKPTSYFKKKVRHYMKQIGHTYENAILVEKDIDSRWLDHLPRIDSDSIKAIKLPRDGSAGPRVDATYEYYVADASLVVTRAENTTVTLPKGKTMVYISPQDMRETYRKQGTDAVSLMKKLGSDYVLVVLGKNRFEKFLRTHSAIHVKHVLQSKVDTLVASATNAEYLTGQLDYYQAEFLKKMPLTDIKDKELVDIAKVVQTGGGNDNYSKAETLTNWARRCSVVLTLPPRQTADMSVLDRYPLIEMAGSRNMKHLVIYVNAVYEALHK